MRQGVRTAQQSSSEHESWLPSDWWNDLKGHGFVAPDKRMSLSDHSSEEILVFSSAKIRPEWLRARFDNGGFQKYVSGSALPPVNEETSRITRPFIKLASSNPLRRFLVKVGSHRTEDAIHAIYLEGREERQQPPVGRKLVVIDEGNIISVSIFNGPVP